jgi:hypothetical protein
MTTKLKLELDIIDRKCPLCNYIFSEKRHLLRHLNNRSCPSISKFNRDRLNDDGHNDDGHNDDGHNDDGHSEENYLKLLKLIEEQTQQIKELKENQITSNQNIEKQIEQLKEKPNVVVNNNVLNVVCMTPNDNYLDMLTTNLGDFNKALEYIKSCALSHIKGDCQLIERIYLNPERSKPSFHYLDKSRTRIEYFDEKEELTINKKEQFGRKLAHNLQNSYLKGINQVINNNLDQRKCPNKFLAEYDLQTWNQHIYNLSDLSYQRKFMNQLDIPNKA